MKRSKNELPQGTLDLLVLQVVSLGPLHGYAITKRIQQVSHDLLKIRHGSLYPALHRLEARAVSPPRGKPRAPDDSPSSIA